jgi:hypothetical protein
MLMVLGAAGADGARRRLEDRLGRVIATIERTAIDRRQDREAKARAEAERRVRWQAAMIRARQAALDAHHAKILQDQESRWRRAARLHAYCDALAQRIDAAETTGEDADPVSARAWLTWARAYADAIDPLRGLPAMPELHAPEPDELKPFLKGWSPHGPDRRLW